MTEFQHDTLVPMEVKGCQVHAIGKDPLLQIQSVECHNATAFGIIENNRDFGIHKSLTPG